MRNRRLPELDTSFALLALTITLAGVVRGLSGFGSGLIIAPVAAALYDPVTAVAMLVVIDSLPTLPVTLPVVKLARWREVLPVLAGMAMLVPLGVYILKHTDTMILRWIICIAILTCVAILWSGWRYRGSRGLPVSIAVGGLSGLLSGIAALPGPPVVIYWMASSLPTAIIRANLLTLFLFSEVFSAANLWAAGLFNRERLLLGLVLTPLYALSVYLGGKLYGAASDAVYRRLALTLVAAAALLALPATDALLGMFFRTTGNAP